MPQYLADEPLPQCACDDVGHDGPCPPKTSYGVDWQTASVQQAAMPSYLGWTPPLVYDVTNDCRRVATQADIDRLERFANEYASLRRVFTDWLQWNGAQITWLQPK